MSAKSFETFLCACVCARGCCGMFWPHSVKRRFFTIAGLQGYSNVAESENLHGVCVCARGGGHALCFKLIRAYTSSCCGQARECYVCWDSHEYAKWIHVHKRGVRNARRGVWGMWCLLTFHIHVRRVVAPKTRKVTTTVLQIYSIENVNTKSREKRK